MKKPKTNNPINPTPRDVYQAAKSYMASGLSLIPIRADGTKMPAFEMLPKVWCEETGKYRRPWSGYKEARPTLEEIRAWFRESDSGAYGLAIIGGAVSGGLEIVDCDNWDAAQRWSELVEKKAPGLLDRLVRVRSPRPGMHAYYRCAEFGGNQKLARVPDPAHDNKKPKTIIEVKGEAGYCLAPPSPSGCHKSGRCYVFDGDTDLTMVTTIAPQERSILLNCARELNCWVEAERPAFSARRRRNKAGKLHRPGDDFNEPRLYVTRT